MRALAKGDGAAGNTDGIRGNVDGAPVVRARWQRLGNSGPVHNLHLANEFVASIELDEPLPEESGY